MIDETGNRYGKLTVTRRVEPKPGTRHARFAVTCDCGNETEIDGYVLRQGRSNSCGCLRKSGTPSTTSEAEERIENA